MIGSYPKTGGPRTQSERNSSRGIQHRSSGSGLVNRVVYLVGLPGRPTIFLYSPVLMALTKDQKTAQLNELKDKMQRSQSIIFANYIGMNVADVSDLRAQLKKSDAEMKVAKKTLMQIAAKDLNLPALEDAMLNGAVACIFSFADPLTGAQIAFKFGKAHPQVQLIGGIYEGKLLSKDGAISLAKIPGKLQLLGMFAAMCNGPLSSFARGLSELAKQKEAPKAETAPVAEPAPAAPATETPAAEAAPTTPATDAPASSEAVPETPAPEAPAA